MSKKNNYSNLLGIDPFRDTDYGTEEIGKIIENKEKRWRQGSTDMQKEAKARYKYGVLLAMVPEIDAYMSDPQSREADLEEARILLKGRCQKLRTSCVILEDGTHVVLKMDLKTFKNNLNWENIEEKRIMELAGVVDRRPALPVSDEVEMIHKEIEKFGVYTPADVLNILILNPDLKIDADELSDASTPSTIRSAFEACNSRVQNVNANLLKNQDLFVSFLRELKRIVTDDGELRSLVSYSICNRDLEPILERMQEEYGRTMLSRGYIDDLIRTLAPDVDLTLAIPILENFCYRKNIYANFSGEDQVSLRCPSCESLVTAGPGDCYCTACGYRIRFECPGCHMVQSANNRFCPSCNFDFETGPAKAKSLETMFRKDLKDGDMKSASENLSALKAGFSTLVDIEFLTRRFEDASKYIDEARSALNRALENERFYEAGSMGEELIQLYPKALEGDIGIQYRLKEATRRRENADAHYAKAMGIAKDDPDAALSLCIMAVSECQDHPGAKSMLNAHPPEDPELLDGEVDGTTLNVVFDGPDEKGVTYCIYREKGQWPEVNDSTVPYFETTQKTFEDSRMEVATDYYYKIYTRRWGVLCRNPGTVGPVTTYEPVRNVEVEKMRGGFRLTFEKPRAASRVVVTRGDPDANTLAELPIGTQTVYEDLGLQRGKVYHYRFEAEYTGSRGMKRSHPYEVVVEVMDAPEPPRNLRINWDNANDVYTARWESDRKVILFSSTLEHNFDSDIVNMDSLRSSMSEVNILREGSCAAHFHMDEGEVKHIYPVIPMGKIGVVGEECRVVGSKPFRNIEKRMGAEDCTITMEWPNRAVEARIVISDDIPRGLDCDTAEMIVVNRKDYERTNNIRIPLGEHPHRVLNIFAMYRVQGGNMVESPPSEVHIYTTDCTRVRYTLTKERGNIRIDLKTDPSIESLPRMVLVSGSDGIPLNRKDGTVEWDSEIQLDLNNGEKDLTIMHKMPKRPEMFRLFFVDDEKYNLFGLIHPVFRRR